MIIRILAGCAAAAAATCPARADTSCDTVSFPAQAVQSVHVARVKPGPHATFLSGRDACPNAGTCQLATYVIAGDRLLTSVTEGPYTCAYYTNGRTETAGWLPTVQLQPQSIAPAARQGWFGTWRYGDSTITIKQSGTNLAVAAQAYWPSKIDPNGHEATLEAEAKPNAARLAVADAHDPQGCRLALVLFAGHLIAHDNGICGGANVTLSGIYRK